MRSTVLCLLMLLALAPSVSGAESPALATDKDKINYAMGVNIISSIKQQGFELDLDMVIRGMKDAAAGKNILMSEEELKKTILALQTEVRRRERMAPIVAAKEGRVFLEENRKKDGVVVRPSGLQYKVLKQGAGSIPADADLVVCNYRGTLLNGEEFDRSYPGRPVTFSVREGGGMRGLSEALKLMPVGSSWQLYIPADLAYGERGRLSVLGTPVRPNETVLVEVELLEIKKP
ncbi:MAG: FKBP-type peptidyl-prolyl cis-trans isomerase [Nitrospiraceae bacterium]|nr:FKBP-type peptidyl-prolyl cis-trans isomerase [Nitrospiraceae bacterium]